MLSFVLDEFQNLSAGLSAQSQTVETQQNHV